MTALSTWIGGDAVASKIKSQQLGFWVYIIPIAVLLTGSVKIMRFWLLRARDFKLVAFSRFGESTVSAVTKISIGFLVGSCAGGLIAGVIFGLVMSLLIVLMNPATQRIKNQIHSITRSDLWLVAGTYRKFPLFSTWNALLNAFSQQLVILMFSYYFSPAVVGSYSLGSRVLKEPIILLSESIQNAYFQKAAHDLGQGQHLQSSYKKITAFLFLIGIAPFLILHLRGSSIFTFLFGAQWSTTGLYIESLAPWFFLLFIGTPTNVIYEVLYKQDIKLFLNITKFTLAFLALFIGYLLYRDALSILKIFVSVNVMLELLTISIAFIIVYRQQNT
jgi:lipopolysaccharide exporter